MALELRDIHKHFGNVRANDGISLAMAPGRIHGILGENGAGKSTLMKILSGYLHKTSGEILFDGKPLNYTTPAQASRFGIGMLYQDPLDFPVMSVLDNFMVGQSGILRNRKPVYRKRFEELSRSIHFSLDPDTPVTALTIGERQQLEILRLLSLGIRVLILDEPTTGISSEQKEVLFSALKKLADDGRNVILVSHKLEDVEALCDSVTVLREGRVSGEMDRPFNTFELLKMMFGEPPKLTARKKVNPGEEVLHLDGVSAPGGRTGLSDCSISVRAGEVIGLAGLEGSGQDVFLRVASGLIQPAKGSVALNGNRMTGKDYHTFKASGVTFQPASRLEEGLIQGLSVTEHCALKDKRRSPFVRWEHAYRTAQHKIKKFQVVGSPENRVESLSGGNQQRLLLSFLPAKPKLLLLENPTRGLDMESVYWVWEHLDEYCHGGVSIVFSSSELDEILMAADRILVFFNGRIIEDVRKEETSSLELGRAIAGKLA
ncbi:MAG TPA: ATP-binding cassette domain-containing protein [Deltaproteobacteria bacterium]|nr:ATP-binding cassette domain-containing protein [Deltaproteobacteria bacterium]HPJ94667.1 ATP-binding cassette domain-containing protein [Deltaproteobacteria bacterium]HPR52066.1 ATP-binding cassette domain-containing protein [Deltaproteobacteria bacterium]